MCVCPLRSKRKSTDKIIPRAGPASLNTGLSCMSLYFNENGEFRSNPRYLAVAQGYLDEIMKVYNLADKIRSCAYEPDYSQKSAG